VLLSPHHEGAMPFFILEFKIGDVQVHKDLVVVAAEAAHVLNRIRHF